MSKNTTQIGSALVIAVIAILVLLIGGLGYVAWNSFFHKTPVQNQQTNAQQSSTPALKEDIKTTLPNGKIATYPDTTGNGNVTFSDAGNGDPHSIYIFISHKAYDQYLTSLGQSKVDELCGPDDNLKALKVNIIFGLLNTSNKIITPPQNGNCVELIASTDNTTDTALRPGAQAVLDTVTKDINAFLASVTIQ